jgi:hypothetical protein
MIEKLKRINFIAKKGQQEELNLTLLNRYPNVPKEYLTFLSEIEYCENRDEKSWFNTISDFNGTTDNEFRWNEFEIMSLEGYQDENDEQTRVDEINKVTAFWDNHIPFLMSCKNFYCYFAICLLPATFGQIVYGNEPEFEETKPVANDFSVFMTKLLTQTLDKKYLEQVV